MTTVPLTVAFPSNGRSARRPEQPVVATRRSASEALLRRRGVAARTVPMRVLRKPERARRPRRPPPTAPAHVPHLPGKPVRRVIEPAPPPVEPDLGTGWAPGYLESIESVVVRPDEAFLVEVRRVGGVVVAVDAPVPLRLVEPDRLHQDLVGVEPEPVVTEAAGGRLELDEQAGAEPA